jgi:hypothetical protein
VPFKQSAAADLMDVGALAFHPEQVAHDVAVAQAILRLAGGGEDDASVWQIDQIDVVDLGLGA